jgi:integrase
VIRRAVTYGFDGPCLAPPKTRRTRTVPLGDRAIRALQRHKAAQAEHKLKLGGTYEDQGLIFATETGGLMDSHNIVNRHFKPLLAKAKLLAIRLYDLRHSHATLLMAAGEHPKVVQERLGHSTIQLTLDTYTHVVPGMQQRAAAKLEELLDAERTAKGPKAQSV